jgi:hypothetical protein
MNSLMRSSIALALLLATCGMCYAVEVLKQEPPVRTDNAPGTNFLVDDGTCGQGRIKEVTIGDWNTHMDASMAKDLRKPLCIAENRERGHVSWRHV